MNSINRTRLALILAAFVWMSLGNAQSDSDAKTQQASEPGVASDANRAANADAATAAPENIFPSADELSGSGILEDRDDYLAERGWTLGYNDSNPSGSYIGWGTANIAVSPESSDYGGARGLAVDAAVAEAMGQFALSEGLEAQAEVVRRVVQDPNALQRAQREAGQGYAKAIFDRVANLTTAQLDRALEELGVDPARHAELDFSEKVTLAQDSVQRGVAREAFESFRGVRLLKTFEEESAVGALVIHNSRFAELAQRITDGDLVAIGDGVSSDAVNQIATELSSEELLFMHGVRLLRDAEGNPVIVSFGQASPAVTRSDSDMAINMAVTASQRSAELNADRGIADFLGSQVEVDDESLATAAAQSEGTLNGDGRATITDAASFAERLNSTIRQSSEVDLAGITTVRSWRTNHPDTGHLYVGTVKMWSPASAAAFTGERRAPTSGSAESPENSSVDIERRSSPEFGTEDW